MNQSEKKEKELHLVVDSLSGCEHRNCGYNDNLAVDNKKGNNKNITIECKDVGKKTLKTWECGFIIISKEKLKLKVFMRDEAFSSADFLPIPNDIYLKIVLTPSSITRFLFV